MTRRIDLESVVRGIVLQAGFLPPGPASGAGSYSQIEVRRPCVLQPTWSQQLGPAAIVADETFNPRLYWTSEENMGALSPGQLPAAQPLAVRVAATGTIYFATPGTYRVINPNVTHGVPYVLIDAPDWAAAQTWLQKQGNFPQSVSNTPPGNAGAELAILGWDVFRTYVSVGNAAAPSFQIAPGFPVASFAAPIVGQLVANLGLWVSPAPWAFHTIISTAVAGTADQARILAVFM